MASSPVIFGPGEHHVLENSTVEAALATSIERFLGRE